jgi:hypothetical protein
MPLEAVQVILVLSFLGVCGLVSQILLENRREHRYTRFDALSGSPPAPTGRRTG